MRDNEEEGFLDGRFMRIVASAVIVACVGLLAYLNRDKLVERPQGQSASLNPEFIKCRDERVGQLSTVSA